MAFVLNMGLMQDYTLWLFLQVCPVVTATSRKLVTVPFFGSSGVSAEKYRKNVLRSKIARPVHNRPVETLNEGAVFFFR